MTTEDSAPEDCATIEIREDDLTGPEIAQLLSDHLTFVFEQSPPESCHALDLSGLKQPGVTFWSAWIGAALAGCGALMELDAETGEIKSMRTDEGHRRRGVGGRMLDHLLAVARARGYRRVYLETGSQPGFAPARALYESRGFTECGAYGDYSADPNSCFFTLALD